MSFVALVLAPCLLLSPAAGNDLSTDCSLRLRKLEAALRGAPDDLFLGAEYRQVVLECEGGERATRFFDGLVKRHPDAANALLNAGLAQIDRVPFAGDMRQALLGRAAAKRLGRVIERRPSSWIALFTRASVYLAYPRFLKQYGKGIDDLKAALAIQKEQPLRPWHARTYVTLGDALFWRADEFERARRVWAEGLALFPGDPALRERTSKKRWQLKQVVSDALSPDRRIDTSLSEFRDDALISPAASATESR